VNSHRALIAWQVCRKLVSEVYRVTAGFPPGERFALALQLRRAAVSATSNIAEGYARFGARETAHGLSLSLGSLAEVDSLLAVAEDLGYLDTEHLASLEALRVRASRLVFGLQRKVRARR